MKQRFSSLDIKVITHELNARLVSLRLANIYDLSSRIFLLKFAKPDHREQFVIDSGFRCHLTEFARATAAAPSPFVARLRKLIRTRRVTSVSQVGTDRIIELQFSDGLYRLFLEFYAGGNIVLTDNDLNIIALLRNVSEGAENEQYKLGLKYNLELRQNYNGVPPLTAERLRTGLQRAAEKQLEEAQKPGKKTKRKAGDALRKALAVTTTEFPPILIDHALHVAGINRDVPVEDVIKNEELMNDVLNSLKEAQKEIDRILSENVAKGYILAKRSKGSLDKAPEEEGSGKSSGVMYDDFHPFKPAQLTEDPSIVFLEHQGYNATVDDFFSSIEGQKLESRLHEREENAKRKIEQARQEQANRIGGLQEVQDQNVRKAQAIEANVERVEEATAAVNGLVAQGMDWIDIGHLIENEQKRGNAVAQIIKLPLKLNENTVTLLLSELQVGSEDTDSGFFETDSEPDESDDEDGDVAKQQKLADDKRLAIDIDLALSPWSNARQYYDQRRTAATKQEKTVKASEKALKSTEQRVMADLKKGLKQEKDILRPVRKQLWFEKFIYFISSDGYLVLAGKDAQQNEVLYRRYLKKGDIYIHADLHGAASVIVKNRSTDLNAPIPPTTLSQAGNLAVCTSGAWDSKAVMSAWWVNADQVSKTAPTGEYLTTGGFVVRGKKNFLPPSQLLLGFGVMFQISEESKARHVKHRLQTAENVRGPSGVMTDQKDFDRETSEKDDLTADDDDDFPDAEADPADRVKYKTSNESGNLQFTDDSDDEFPDADHDQAGGREDRKSHHNDASKNFRFANPLQPGNTSASRQRVAQDRDDTEGEASLQDDFDHNEQSQESEADDDDNADDETSKLTEQQDPEAKSATQSDEVDSKAPRQNSKPQSQNQHKQKQAKPVRGKKGKAKKIAAKYADQDDEDRELAMRLLGSQAPSQTKSSAPSDAKSESAIEARERRRAQHEKAQREGLEAEEVRRLNLEEGVDVLDEDEAGAVTQLDAYVGTPLPGDEILEAIPVCAPWTALGKFKYKVKLQPGQQKKGKAVREILGKWIKDGSDNKKVDQKSEDVERIWPREIELIKGWKEVEIVGILPVKSVRVMMSGGGAGNDRAKAKGGRGGKGSKRK